MKRSSRKGTQRFLISGPAPGFPNGIHEWTSEMNEAQALKQVAIRLQKKYPDIKIYLGNCTVTKTRAASVPTLRPGYGEPKEVRDGRND